MPIAGVGPTLDLWQNVADSSLLNSAASTDYKHNFVVDLMMITSDGSQLQDLYKDGAD